MRPNPALLVDDPMPHARVTVLEEGKQLRERLAHSVDLVL
jgi:hypothetical protein